MPLGDKELKNQKSEEKTENPQEARPTSLPIVGIGASAGGLEAVSELLRHLPPETGMGFVLVQHLDPQHASALTEILSKSTSMKVSEVLNSWGIRQAVFLSRSSQLTSATRQSRRHERGCTLRVSQAMSLQIVFGAFS